MAIVASLRGGAHFRCQGIEELLIGKRVQRSRPAVIGFPIGLAVGRPVRARLFAAESSPERVRAAAERYPELQVEISEPLGFHDRIVDVVLERLGVLP